MKELYMQPGTLIMLNGTTSAGKTSILRELQAQLPEPFLNAGIDTFLYALPGRYLDDPLWNEVLGKGSSAGPVGQALFSGMHHAIAALLARGCCVIADHVLLDPDWIAECAGLFAEHSAYLIGVRCPLEVLERREQERQDRTLGQARRQFDLVHRHAIYDFEVDTSLHTAQACAALIVEHMRSGVEPQAFRRLSI